MGEIKTLEFSDATAVTAPTDTTDYIALNKRNGTTAPTVNEDSDDGYAVGSIWSDTTNGKDYICQDATVGAAVWTQFAPASAPASSIVSKTTTYTVTTADDIIDADTSGGTWTLTLYTAVGNGGKKIIIKKTTSDSNTLTVDGNSSETIEGSTTVPITDENELLEIVSDGSNWEIINRTKKIVYEELVGTSGPHTTVMPGDDTIPQNTEGTEILTATIIPGAGVSEVLVEVVGSIAETTNVSNTLTAALYQDSTANAIDAKSCGQSGDNNDQRGEYTIRTKISVTVGTSTTFKLRIGGNNGSTQLYANRYFTNVGGTLGAIMVTSMTIIEL